MRKLYLLQGLYISACHVVGSKSSFVVSSRTGLNGESPTVILESQVETFNHLISQRCPTADVRCHWFLM